MLHSAHSALTVAGDYQPRLASIVAVLITTVSLSAALFLFLSFTAAAPADLTSVNGMKRQEDALVFTMGVRSQAHFFYLNNRYPLHQPNWSFQTRLEVSTLALPRCAAGSVFIQNLQKGSVMFLMRTTQLAQSEATMTTSRICTVEIQGVLMAVTNLDLQRLLIITSVTSQRQLKRGS